MKDRKSSDITADVTAVMPEFFPLFEYGRAYYEKILSSAFVCAPQKMYQTLFLISSFIDSLPEAAPADINEGLRLLCLIRDLLSSAETGGISVEMSKGVSEWLSAAYDTGGASLGASELTAFIDGDVSLCDDTPFTRAVLRRLMAEGHRTSVSLTVKRPVSSELLSMIFELWRHGTDLTLISGDSLHHMKRSLPFGAEPQVARGHVMLPSASFVTSYRASVNDCSEEESYDTVSDILYGEVSRRLRLSSRGNYFYKSICPPDHVRIAGLFYPTAMGQCGGDSVRYITTGGAGFDIITLTLDTAYDGDDFRQLYGRFISACRYFDTMTPFRVLPRLHQMVTVSSDADVTAAVKRYVASSPTSFGGGAYLEVITEKGYTPDNKILSRATAEFFTCGGMIISFR